MAKQYKLKFKPTPISRLRNWKVPVPMKGDPDWLERKISKYDLYGQFDSIPDVWKAREEAVYGAQHKESVERRAMIEAGAEEYERIIEELG